jgi:uncharacterized membrane protein YedE/YeeE
VFEYVPWWAGSLALAGVGVGSAWGLRRTLGVSGSLARTLDWKGDLERKKAEAGFDAMNSAQIRAAMLAATAAEFGIAAVTSPQEAAPVGNFETTKTDPWTVHGAFLVMLVVGGFLGAAIKGQVGIRTTYASSFSALFPTPVAQFLVLAAGGFCVGMGTRMAGGCTSGLGLSGCSKLSKAGFIGTACFLGLAIGFTLLLRSVLA